jgi:C-terminal processing protease CtpA/Prc
LTPAGRAEPSYVPQAEVNWNLDLWRRTIAAPGTGWTQVRRNLGYREFDGIPYVAVSRWSGGDFGTSDLDHVVDRFRDAPAMIVDVRMNPGGDDALALHLAGRFTTVSVVFGYYRLRNGPAHSDLGEEVTRRFGPSGGFQFTKPVIVLAGRGAFSSTESFVSAMRELPHVTIAGDTTGGGSGNPAFFALGGGWRYTVSRWIESMADRRVIEWNGIPPDLHVPWDPAAVAADRDPVLEAAIAVAKTKAPEAFHASGPANRLKVPATPTR